MDDPWATSIVSNRLFRIAPDGAATLVFEDGDGEHVAHVEAALTDRSVTRRDHRTWYDPERPQLFADVLRAAKQRLDPHHVLNPGVLIDR